jgi:cytochrome c oxidase assembly protein subunit 11
MGCNTSFSGANAMIMGMVQDRNKRTGLVVAGVVAGMIALSFASVPLYRLFCQVTGFGGRAEQSIVLTSSPSNLTVARTVTVKFNADVNAHLPWVFRPNDRAMTVNIGADGLTSFTAINESNTPITGTAVFNVLPEKAGKYFHKTQCFCFGEQRLNPGETVNMPVLFYIDPEFANDPNMDGVKHLTLSYTFYRADSAALDRAMSDLK